MMYEFIFSAPHGTTLGFEETKDGVEPILGDNSVNNSAIETFQASALDTCREFLKYYDELKNTPPYLGIQNYRKFIQQRNFNDLKMFLYPGGHVDSSDVNTLSAAKREILEETGLDYLEQLKISDDGLMPIDIDTHKIGYNERLNLPEHYHFDFRYLFVVDRIQDIKIDTEEMSDFKWIGLDELINDLNYGSVAAKIKRLIPKKSKKL